MEHSSISFEQAYALVIENSAPLGDESSCITNAGGRRLAEDVIAKRDSPAFSNSKVDGYALSTQHIPPQASTDIYNLKVIGESRAGLQFSLPNNPDLTTSCIRISTGAELPPNFDSIVMLEDVEVEGDSIVFKQLPIAGTNVRFRGEDFTKDTLLITKRAGLDPSHMALLASAGISELLVFRKPKIGIIVTGDEVVSSTNDNQAAISTDANGPGIQAVLSDLHYESALDYSRDSFETTLSVIANSLENNDLIIITGGISVGPYDFVRPALTQLGVEQVFWQVRVKPGRPTYFGVLKSEQSSKYILALPGNPVSAMVMLQAFGIPLINNLEGADTNRCPRTISAQLTEDLVPTTSRHELARGTLTVANGTLQVTPIVNRESHLLTGLAGANVLIHLQENSGTISKGDWIQVQALSYFRSNKLQ